MKRFLVYFFILWGFKSQAQMVSPDDFLGYELGSNFTPHYKVIDYFKQIAAANKNIKLFPYGQTYEGKTLLVAVISSPENMDKLEFIRKNNLALSRVDQSAETNLPAILWLSYNVHGNEANSTETALKVLYTLAKGDENIQKWLQKVVVIIDPCLNPDGRDRYVNYYNSVKGIIPNLDPNSREHNEPSPTGRSNHYYFDLNRDWAWQTQIETQQRVALYQQWMPQVHIDFHEQGYNEAYFFAPAAEPIHAHVTPWQKEFQTIIGKKNAAYFDTQGWKYFTKERFDLLYPSYGDTYPIYNGAIGMTYEQGGIKAGLAVVTHSGDTLTLKDRINHHFATSLISLETVANTAPQLISEFKKYFEQSINNPPGLYKTYVIKAEGNTERLHKLAQLLTKNQISYAFGGNKTTAGFNFDTQKTEPFKIERNDLIVNMQQPRAVLASVLFEPQTAITDSNTYDITAWALPYLYGLRAYAAKESFKGNFSAMEDKKPTFNKVEKPYAWVVSWANAADAKTLIALQKQQIKVRIANEGFTSGGKNYPSGTLLIYRAENEKQHKNIADIITQTQSDFNLVLEPIVSGFVEKGKDFGSNSYRLLTSPKIAIVAGEEVFTGALGAFWHYFEQELNYPVSLINTSSIGNLELAQINTLIIPNGFYNGKLTAKLSNWISSGGKLILMEDAIEAFVGKENFEIKKREYPKEEPKKNNQPHLEKPHFEDAIPGAIYKIFIDKTSPISLGLGNSFYALKTNDSNYELLSKGYNIGVLKPTSYVAGIVGSQVKKKLNEGLQIGMQAFGKGTVIYLANDILFRSMLESGKQMLNNIIFLVK